MGTASLVSSNLTSKDRQELDLLVYRKELTQNVTKLEQLKQNLDKANEQTQKELFAMIRNHATKSQISSTSQRLITSRRQAGELSSAIDELKMIHLQIACAEAQFDVAKGMQILSRLYSRMSKSGLSIRQMSGMQQTLAKQRLLIDARRETMKELTEDNKDDDATLETEADELVQQMRDASDLEMKFAVPPSIRSSADGPAGGPPALVSSQRSIAQPTTTVSRSLPAAANSESKRQENEEKKG